MHGPLFTLSFWKGWVLWKSLFSGIPYGDPYLATAAAVMLFVAVGAGVKYIRE